LRFSQETDDDGFIKIVSKPESVTDWLFRPDFSSVGKNRRPYGPHGHKIPSVGCQRRPLFENLTTLFAQAGALLLFQAYASADNRPIYHDKRLKSRAVPT